jgi:NADH-quinone oxidoreductase subunit J
MTTALFLGFGAVLLASSLLVVLHKNPVTSALFLVLAFCSLAGVYLILQAEFIGMVQIIVYAGAIMVLFLFVIMYLNLGQDLETGVQTMVRRAVGWLIGATLVVEGALLFGRRWASGPVSPAPPGPAVGNTQALGSVLYTRYLFPFEVTSIVLLVAMVGAVVIARGRLGAAGEKRALRESSAARAPSAAGGEPAAREAARAGPEVEAEPVGAVDSRSGETA